MIYCNKCKDKHNDLGSCNYCDCPIDLPDREKLYAPRKAHYGIFITDVENNEMQAFPQRPRNGILAVEGEINERLPTYLYYDSGRLICHMCHPLYTTPFVFNGVDGFFADDNVKMFMRHHEHHKSMSVEDSINGQLEQARTFTASSVESLINHKLLSQFHYRASTNKLLCYMCYPQHTVPFVFNGVRGFFQDANVKNFLKEHDHNGIFAKTSLESTIEYAEILQRLAVEPRKYARAKSAKLREKSKEELRHCWGLYGGTSVEELMFRLHATEKIVTDLYDGNDEDIVTDEVIGYVKTYLK